MSKCSKKVLGERPKSNNNRYENEEVVKLSEKQEKMRGQIDSTRNKKLKAKKRKERNKILNETKELIKKKKEKVIKNWKKSNPNTLMSPSVLRQFVY